MNKRISIINQCSAVYYFQLNNAIAMPMKYVLADTIRFGFILLSKKLASVVSGDPCTLMKLHHFTYLFISGPFCGDLCSLVDLL